MHVAGRQTQKNEQLKERSGQLIEGSNHGGRGEGRSVRTFFSAHFVAFELPYISRPRTDRAAAGDGG